MRWIRLFYRATTAILKMMERRLLGTLCGCGLFLYTLGTSWGPTLNACIVATHSVHSLSVSSLEECKDACVNFTGTCRSVVFHIFFSTCFLYQVTGSTVQPSTDYEEPCSDPPNSYAERLDISTTTTTATASTATTTTTTTITTTSTTTAATATATS